LLLEENERLKSVAAAAVARARDAVGALETAHLREQRTRDEVHSQQRDIVHGYEAKRRHYKKESERLHSRSPVPARLCARVCFCVFEMLFVWCFCPFTSRLSFHNTFHNQLMSNSLFFFLVFTPFILQAICSPVWPSCNVCVTTCRRAR
jgi:hypothetical protein